jgi:hypothetical protein
MSHPPPCGALLRSHARLATLHIGTLRCSKDQAGRNVVDRIKGAIRICGAEMDATHLQHLGVSH